VTDGLSAACFVLAGVGLVLVALQGVAVWLHVRKPARARTTAPTISVVKPLCGTDDALAANIDAFAALAYPAFELLLGVGDAADPAWPVALAAARRHPGRVRAILQRGEPGENPKVNQLITLAAEARGEILVVSDSNIRPPADYLDGIAAGLEDARVGLVTHLISGAGEATWGSTFDALHLATAIGPGVIGAKLVLGKNIVVGKSMAVRRADLDALGGFERVKDVLAEDYVFGNLVGEEMGKTVAIARSPIVQITERRSVLEFVARYLRWSVIHRKSVPTPLYFGELLLNPVALAAVGVGAAPSAAGLATFAAVAGAKLVLDTASARRLRSEPFAPRALLAIPVKDLLIAFAWAVGLVSSRVRWRGRRYRVLPGTRLAADGGGIGSLGQRSVGELGARLPQAQGGALERGHLPVGGV
jgi:ceramide glucosyltransferase